LEEVWIDPDRSWQTPARPAPTRATAPAEPTTAGPEQHTDLTIASPSEWDGIWRD